MSVVVFGLWLRLQIFVLAGLFVVELLVGLLLRLIVEVFGGLGLLELSIPVGALDATLDAGDGATPPPATGRATGDSSAQCQCQQNARPLWT